MAEAETENQALDVEALTGILQGRAIRQTFPLGPSILITTAERDAIIAALERAEELEALMSCFVDPDPCRFDHHGGCQAHGFLSLQPGEKCPQAELNELLAPAPTKGGG